MSSSTFIRQWFFIWNHIIRIQHWARVVSWTSRIFFKIHFALTHPSKVYVWSFTPISCFFQRLFLDSRVHKMISCCPVAYHWTSMSVLRCLFFIMKTEIQTIKLDAEPQTGRLIAIWQKNRKFTKFTKNRYFNT